MRELIVSDDLVDEDAQLFTRLQRGEHVVRFDTVRRRRDGMAIRVSLSAFPTLDRERQLRGFGVALVESSVHLAAMFQETEALFSVLHSNAIISVTDCEGKIIDVNDAFCRTSGYRRDELLGVDHRIVNSGAHDRGFWSDLWRTIDAGKPWHGEICNRAQDGALYWVDSVIDPTLHDFGHVDKHVAIQFDITNAKRAARELSIERTRLDNIFRAANLGTWEWNVQTGEMRLNAGWAALVGEAVRTSSVDSCALQPFAPKRADELGAESTHGPGAFELARARGTRSCREQPPLRR
jgi:PAS domain S-box-containing protein